MSIISGISPCRRLTHGNMNHQYGWYQNRAFLWCHVDNHRRAENGVENFVNGQNLCAIYRMDVSMFWIFVWMVDEFSGYTIKFGSFSRLYERASYCSFIVKGFMWSSLSCITWFILHFSLFLRPFSFLASFPFNMSWFAT